MLLIYSLNRYWFFCGLLSITLEVLSHMKKIKIRFTESVQVLLLVVLIILGFSMCGKEEGTPDTPDTPEIPKSAETNMTSFNITAGEVTFSAELQSDGKTFYFLVPLLYNEQLFDHSTLASAKAAFILSEGATSVPASGQSADFNNDVYYNVTAEDGKTTKEYVVKKASGTSDKKEITDFKIEIDDVLVNCDISATDRLITIPFLPNVDLSDVTPTFTLSPGATASPASGEAQNFPASVEYEVTAHDGSKATWTVQPTTSDEAKVLTFTLTMATGNKVEKIECNIDEEASTITGFVPFYLRNNLSDAVPTFTLSPGATADPASGIAQDFTKPIEITATAHDGTTKRVWNVEIAIGPKIGLDGIIAGAPVNLGSPFPISTSTTTFNSAVTKQGDNHILCVVSGGAPSVLNVIDIENPHAVKILETYDVTVGQVWANVVDSKGNYYFAGYDDGTRFYRYAPNNPEGQRLQQLGSSYRGAVTAMEVDDEDNVYFTNSRNGTIVRYNAEDNTFTNFGRVSNTSGTEHVRSIAYYNGYLYGGQQKSGAAFFRYKLDTGQVEYLTNAAAGINTYYTMKVVRNYLFVYSQGGGNLISIYDMDAGKWIAQETTAGLYPTGEIDGFVYFTNSNQSIRKFNLATREITSTGVSLTNHGLRGFGTADLTSAAPYNGKFFVSVLAQSGNIDFINFTTNQRHRVSNVITSSGNVVIQNLGFLGDNFYASAYMGGSNMFSRTNIHTGARQTHTMGQVEGMTAYNGKMYTGVYPNARVYEYNPATNSSTEMFSIGQSQDRPFQIKASDNKLFIGTISGSSALGGALTVYDMNTRAISVHRNIVQDQSVTGVAYKAGKVYGSTTINGGLGSSPTQTRAKLFIYDVNSKEKIREVTPSFSSASTVTHIGELCFAPDGRLWGAAGGIIFEIDTETLAIKSEIRVSSGGTFGTWRPIYMYFDNYGIMFANPGGNLIAFDPETSQFKNIAPSAGGNVVFFAINEERNTIVFNRGSATAQVFRLDISRNE